MSIDTRFAAKDAATVTVTHEPTGHVCSVTQCGFPLRNTADRYLGAFTDKRWTSLLRGLPPLLLVVGC